VAERLVRRKRGEGCNKTQGRKLKKRGAKRESWSQKGGKAKDRAAAEGADETGHGKNMAKKKGRNLDSVERAIKRPMTEKKNPKTFQKKRRERLSCRTWGSEKARLAK